MSDDGLRRAERAHQAQPCRGTAEALDRERTRSGVGVYLPDPQRWITYARLCAYRVLNRYPGRRYLFRWDVQTAGTTQEDIEQGIIRISMRREFRPPMEFTFTPEQMREAVNTIDSSRAMRTRPMDAADLRAWREVMRVEEGGEVHGSGSEEHGAGGEPG